MDTPSYPMAEVNLRKHKLKEFLSFTQKTKTTTIRKVVVFSMFNLQIFFHISPSSKQPLDFSKGCLSKERNNATM
jgi:hypothetical protein